MKSLLASLVALLTLAAHGEPVRVFGAPSLTPKATAYTTWRNANAVEIREVRLEAPLKHLSAEDVVRGEKALPIGTRREVPRARGRLSLNWQAAPGGGVSARVRVHSTGAVGMRVALRFEPNRGPREVRVASTKDASRIYLSGDSQWGDAQARDGLWWTPLTDGDAQDLEFWDDSGPASGATVEIVAVSHLDASPATGFKAGGIGAAQGCHEDVVCVAAINPGVAQAARSVMKIAYVRNGMSYVCSGTLLNDGASRQVPYVYTAAHCIDSQAVAATVNTFWYFEAAQCGTGNPSAYQQLAGGATLLYVDAATDVALLRLSDRAPQGAWFSGWDATAATPGSSVIGLHHPMGDLKKLAIGDVVDDPDPRAIVTGWRVGSTEPGSSGSGLFTASGGEYLLRGGLKGGSASCTTSGNLADPSNRDEYSRIDLALPALLPWLGGQVAPVEDFAGLWYDPGEPGWGLGIAQSAQGKAFVTWYTYDADGLPRWFFAPEVRWTSTVALAATLYRTSGSAYQGVYDPSRFASQAVGSIELSFGQGTATARISVEGRVIEKPLVRMQL